jgi:hypothetical protein
MIHFLAIQEIPLKSAVSRSRFTETPRRITCSPNGLLQRECMVAMRIGCIRIFLSLSGWKSFIQNIDACHTVGFAVRSIFLLVLIKNCSTPSHLVDRHFDQIAGRNLLQRPSFDDVIKAFSLSLTPVASAGNPKP